MAGERLARIIARLAAMDAPSAPARLCQLCHSVSLLSGAGIMLISGDTPGWSLCTSDEVSALIEDLQYTLGEGPCVEAYHQERPVLVADLASPSGQRWPAFSPAALAVGARAVFGFPLHVGAVRLGALNLWRDRAGALSDEQHADALVLAGVAARAVLAFQADAPQGELGAELESGTDLRLVVHQAAGMVAAQLEVGVGEALVRLRAYAFSHDMRIDDVAREVVARRLRFP